MKYLNWIRVFVLILLIHLVPLGAAAEPTETLLLEGNSIIIVDQLIRSSLTGYDYRKFRNIINTATNKLEIQEVECLLEEEIEPTKSAYKCVASYARMRDIKKAKHRIKVKQFAIRVSIDDEMEIEKLESAFFVNCQYGISSNKQKATVYFYDEKNGALQSVLCSNPKNIDDDTKVLSHIDDQAVMDCRYNSDSFAAYVSRRGQLLALNSRICEPTYYQWFKDKRDSILGVAGKYGRLFLEKIQKITR